MNAVAPDTVGISSSRLDRIRTVMQSYVDQGKLPGAVTMIARRGKVVHAECFGLRDIEARKPMQLPVTAVAMMILYEEGRYQLFDPLSKFIPEFKDVQVVKTTEGGEIELTELEREITIHDLLTQTSGLVSESWFTPPLAKLVEENGLYRPENTLQEYTQRLVKAGQTAAHPSARQGMALWRVARASWLPG